MRATRLGAALALLLPLGPVALAGQDRGGPGIDDFITLPIVSDPQVSPDGNLVAYTLSTPSFEENRASSRVWIADLATAGSTQVPAPAGNDRAPRWSPDGRWLAFISTRDGAAQIWRLPAICPCKLADVAL